MGTVPEYMSLHQYPVRPHERLQGWRQHTMLDEALHRVSTSSSGDSFAAFPGKEIKARFQTSIHGLIVYPLQQSNAQCSYYNGIQGGTWCFWCIYEGKQKCQNLS